MTSKLCNLANYSKHVIIHVRYRVLVLLLNQLAKFLCVATEVD